jgi:hypothetical protein
LFSRCSCCTKMQVDQNFIRLRPNAGQSLGRKDSQSDEGACYSPREFVKGILFLKKLSRFALGVRDDATRISVHRRHSIE